VHRGDLEDLESVRSGAANSDAVIHTAFNHDFSKYVANCEAERRVVEALGSVLAGSDRLLIVTSGTGMTNSGPGLPSTEDDPPASSKVAPRAASEEAAASEAARGVRVAIVRLPQVHDTVKQGLVTYAIQLAREKGVSAYVGHGLNRWLRLIGSILPTCTDWRWRRQTWTPGIMQSRKRKCPLETSLRPSVEA
jgi:nucleoside-diphosphate-sugar epimerase